MTEKTILYEQLPLSDFGLPNWLTGKQEPSTIVGSVEVLEKISSLVIVYLVEGKIHGKEEINSYSLVCFLNKLFHNGIQIDLTLESISSQVPGSQQLRDLLISWCANCVALKRNDPVSLDADKALTELKSRLRAA